MQFNDDPSNFSLILLNNLLLRLVCSVPLLGKGLYLNLPPLYLGPVPIGPTLRQSCLGDLAISFLVYHDTVSLSQGSTEL